MRSAIFVRSKVVTLLPWHLIAAVENAQRRDGDHDISTDEMLAAVRLAAGTPHGIVDEVRFARHHLLGAVDTTARRIR